MELTDKNIWNYSTELSSDCPALLHELERETYLKTLAPQMMSGQLQGRIMSLISYLVRPESILEIGTFTGYGTLCLCEGLTPNGKITTIEVNPELESISSKYFQKSNYASQIQSYLGNALEIIPTLNESYDLIYIDAGKKDNGLYLDLIVQRLNTNGIILIDNVLWAGKVIQNDLKDDKTQSIRSFNQRVLDDPNLEVVILPIRDGMSVLRKKGS